MGFERNQIPVLCLGPILLALSINWGVLSVIIRALLFGVHIGSLSLCKLQTCSFWFRANSNSKVLGLGSIQAVRSKVPNYESCRVSILGNVFTALGRYLLFGYLDPKGYGWDSVQKPDDTETSSLRLMGASG